MGPETVHLLIEFLIVGEDRGDRGLHGLVHVAWHEAGFEFFFCFGGADEDHAEGAAVHRGGAHLHLVVDLEQQRWIYRSVLVCGESAGFSEEEVKANVVDSCHHLKDSGAGVREVEEIEMPLAMLSKRIDRSATGLTCGNVNPW